MFLKEAALCTLLCFGFVVAVLHLQVYQHVFSYLKVLRADEIPERELIYFHHGWTCMLTVFLVEVITVLLKWWSTKHNPTLAYATACQLAGNLGMLI